MFWIVLWAALFLGAFVFWFVLGRRLWRQAGALGSELHTATTRLEALSGALDTLSDDPSARSSAPAGAARAGSRPAAPEWDVRRSGRRRTR